MDSLAQKKILLGVSGGIAAYKTCELIRMFKKADAEVRVVLTKGGAEFITPLTLQTLSENPVSTEFFDLNQESEIGHIELASWPDLVLIAPASANVLARVAHGFCEDLLSTVICATKKPVTFAPAMNCNMWDNPLVKRNIGLLKECNHHIVEPETGELACGYEGPGRLAGLETIFEHVKTILERQQTIDSRP